MARQLHSYLVRCWDLGTHDERIEIEHIQSGNRTVVDSLDAAIAWLRADPERRSAVAGRQEPPGPGRGQRRER
jgi:hypothetical protein